MLDWVYDLVEKRYGRAAAWGVTLAVAAAILGALIGVLIYLLGG